MHLIPVPIVINVHQSRALARAAKDGCDLAVAANRCAVSAMEELALDTEHHDEPAAAPKSKSKTKKS